MKGIRKLRIRFKFYALLGIALFIFSVSATIGFSADTNSAISTTGNYIALSKRLDTMYLPFGMNAFGTSIELFKKYDRYYYAYEEYVKMEDGLRGSIKNVDTRGVLMPFNKNDAYGYYVFSNGYYVIHVSKDWVTVYNFHIGAKEYTKYQTYKYTMNDGNNKVLIQVMSALTGGNDIIEITKTGNGYIFNNPSHILYYEGYNDTDLMLSNKVASLSDAKAQFLAEWAKYPNNELIRKEFLSINYDSLEKEMGLAIAKLYAVNNVIDFAHDYVNFKPYGAKYDMVNKTLTVYGCKTAGLTVHPSFGLGDGVYKVESVSYDFKIKFRQTSFYEVLKQLKPVEYDFSNDLVYFSNFRVYLSVVNHGLVSLEKTSQPPWIIRSLFDQLYSQVVNGMNIKQVEVQKLANTLRADTGLMVNDKTKAVENLSIFIKTHPSVTNAFLGLNTGELVLLPNNTKSIYYNVLNESWFKNVSGLASTESRWEISSIYKPEVRWERPVVSLLTPISTHVLGIDFPLFYVLDPLVKQNLKTYDETLEIYVINSTGVILYHPQEGLLSDTIAYPEILQAIKTKNTNIIRHTDGFNRYDSIVKRIGTTDFYLVMTVERER